MLGYSAISTETFIFFISGATLAMVQPSAVIQHPRARIGHPDPSGIVQELAMSIEQVRPARVDGTHEVRVSAPHAPRSAFALVVAMNADYAPVRVTVKQVRQLHFVVTVGDGRRLRHLLLTVTMAVITTGDGRRWPGRRT